MKRNNLFLFPAFLLISSTFGFSATATNVLEYRASQKNKGDSFFEDRLDLRLSMENVLLGLRFEAMNPSRETALTRPDSVYSAITQRWLELKSEYFDVVGGTFPATLGSGFLLDCRERRDIQQDNNLDGARVDFKSEHVGATALSGIADWDNKTRFIAGEASSRALPVNAGFGYARYDARAMSPLPALIGETWSANLTSSIDFFAGEVRYARTWRGPNSGGVEYQGEAVYTTSSFGIGPIIFYNEFIWLDSFLVGGYTNRYVTLPLIVREPSYTLISRHLTEINPRKALAYCAEISASDIIGLDLTSSFATIDHEDKPFDYLEIYGSVFHEWEKFSLKGVYEFQRTGEQDPAHNIVLEPLIYFGDNKSLLLDLEFQTGKEFNESVNNLFGSAEFSVSSLGSLGIEGGRLMEWDSGEAQIKPELFARAFIDFGIGEGHKITIAYGKRPGGFTCSGGTCRYEPKFEGLELKISSTF